MIPESERAGYDMHKIVDALVDDGSFFEIKPLFAKELIVGLARLEGRSVGIVANNPMQKGGVLFVDSADKAARFIWLCDAFNVPLVFLADVPGFMVGTQVERQGIIRHGAKMVTAVAEATVPEDLGDRAQGLRRRALRHEWPGVLAHGHAGAAVGQHRGDGSGGRGERGVRQPHRRHRGRGGAGPVRRREATPSTRRTSTCCGWHRSSSSTRSSSQRRCAMS